MVRAQVGNEIGVAAVDKVDETLLGTVVLDGVSNFTVTAAEFRNFRVGQIIDLLTKATGAVGAGAVGRTVTGLDSTTSTVTYSGSDLTLTTAFGAYLTGQWEVPSPTGIPAREDYANLNGGVGVYSGFNAQGNFTSIQSMRDRLKAISPTTYSDTEMDKMTYNDLVYALRVNDYPGSIK